ncbi:hypothetical protein DFP72DRAFT_800813 [Ephemerocybe angulata]|uniref:Uncharacterized protein n=1 Tax=Ephemerocybe angulata TaxID=980116 RepID=A0A8H6IDN8_9AGAR|nr:hypothetical protein DFP72DRAFT_800813 [Tulosesus angulatus]
MDSPVQISPSSTPSSSSPPAEEVNFQGPSGGGYDKGFIGNLTNHLTSFGGSGPSKRRLGGSSYAQSGHGANRDSKSRRRENSGRMDSTGGSHWDNKGPGGKRDKDDLLDQNVVDYLRKEIGDPFQEPSPQRS